ncbi:hypothetical protein PHJA_001428600 [Phtheirospermum japonicum]|uniref:Uncharacterized protein n=1 Tax=Phtheirospermum japonicum TaxID=374723 RepID=A0A830CA14_9LAMI|nr:hypothetical protein PHJA_001428600 [Phtheirospermum japonicum]
MAKINNLIHLERNRPIAEFGMEETVAGAIVGPVVLALAVGIPVDADPIAGKPSTGPVGEEQERCEREIAMEREDEMAYLRSRARETLETLRFPIWRRPRNQPGESLPRGVANVRERRERIGLDLICNTCEQHIPKSETRLILCHFYTPHGPRGSPLTRCYVRCRNCLDDIELGRNIGDANNFTVIGGATQHFPASENAAESHADLSNEAYPDSLLDSPNDFRPDLITWEEVEPSFYDDNDDDVDCVENQVLDLELLRSDLQLLAQMH